MQRFSVPLPKCKSSESLGLSILSKPTGITDGATSTERGGERIVPDETEERFTQHLVREISRFSLQRATKMMGEKYGS
jgi:hypothetical protein